MILQFQYTILSFVSKKEYENAKGWNEEYWAYHEEVGVVHWDAGQGKWNGPPLIWTGGALWRLRGDCGSTGVHMPSGDPAC